MQQQDRQGELIVSLTRQCVRWGLLNMQQLEELDAHPLVGKYDSAVRLVAGWYLSAIFGRPVSPAASVAATASMNVDDGLDAKALLNQPQQSEEQQQEDMLWARACRPRCKLASVTVAG
jgi:hypothetical protein